MQPLDSQKPEDGYEWKCALNVRLESGIVPSINFGSRADEASLLVLDGLVTESLRFQLLEHLTGDGNFDSTSDHLPTKSWTRDVCDNQSPGFNQPTTSTDVPTAPHKRTFGPTPALLRALEGSSVPSSVELQRRVCALFPDHHVFFQPSDMIEAWPHTDEEEDDDRTSRREGASKSEGRRDDDEREESATRAAAATLDARCTAVLANAAVQGDSYAYHVDADPASFPESEFTDVYGM